MYVCDVSYAFVYVRVCMYVCMYVCIHDEGMCWREYTNTQKLSYHLPLDTDIQIHTGKQIFPYRHTLNFIHAYIHTYIHSNKYYNSPESCPEKGGGVSAAQISTTSNASEQAYPKTYTCVCVCVNMHTPPPPKIHSSGGKRKISINASIHAYMHTYMLFLSLRAI